MQARTALVVACITAATPTVANDWLGDPASAGQLLARACITQSLDFDALFASASALVSATGLPVVMQSDEVGLWGDPAGAHLMVSRTIDSLACRLSIPQPQGSESYYEALRTGTDAEILAVYDGALSDEMDKPSPHEAAHQWVMRIPAQKHFAASLDWQRERGVMLSVGYSQIYE